MKVVAPLLHLGVLLYFASAALHSHQYIYTATSGRTSFPEFVAVGMVDGEPVNYYDSIKKEMVPRQEWVNKAVDPDYWKRNTEIATNSYKNFVFNLKVAQSRFNHTEGLHTFQFMYGCEWDDDDGELKKWFDEYGYDGQDFLFLDMKNRRYVAPVQQALITKHKWDNDQALLQYEKNYFTQECVYWLKIYVQHRKSSPEKKISPEVSLLQREPSSPVECHATGFYSKEVMVSWQKDGQDLDKDVALRETVPNGDGTFQKSSILSLNPEEWKNNPGAYVCVVQHKSGGDIRKILTEDEIKTNYVKAIPVGIIIGALAGTLLVIIGLVGFFVWRSRQHPGFYPAKGSDDGSYGGSSSSSSTPPKP